MNGLFDALFQTKASVALVNLAAFVLPWVIRLINQARWSSTTKTLITVAAGFIAAAGWIVIHEYSANRYVIYALVLVGATQLTFYALEPGIRQFEDKTTLAW